MNKNEKKETMEIKKVLNNKDYTDIEKAEYVDFIWAFGFGTVKDSLQQKEYDRLKGIFAESLYFAVENAICGFEVDYLKHLQIAKFVLKLIKKYAYDNKKIDIASDLGFAQIIEDELLDAYSQIKSPAGLYYTNYDTHVAFVTRKIADLLNQIFTKNNIKALEQNNNLFSVYFFELLNMIFEKNIIDRNIIKEKWDKINKKINSVINKQIKFDEKEQKYVIIEEIAKKYTDVYDQYCERTYDPSKKGNYTCKRDDELNCHVIVEITKRDATDEEIKEARLKDANKVANNV